MSSSHTFSSSSVSYSSSSTTSSNGGEPTTTGFQRTHQSYTDPSGTTSERATHQDLGGALRQTTRQTDSSGRVLTGGGAEDAQRITDGGPEVTDVTDQAENDRRYEEAMEDEYAKREGGA